MVDLLYTCHNRKEFVQASLPNLIANTNWDLVSSFTIYCDNCDKETLAYVFGLFLNPVEDQKDWPQVCKNHRIVNSHHDSVVAIMKEWIERKIDANVEDYPGRVMTPSPLLAKIDSDTMVPPGWLDACVNTIRCYPRLDLLGIEAYGDLVKKHSASVYNHSIRPSDHIGGIGLFRRDVFERFPDLEPNPNSPTYYGFTEWQWRHNEIVKAWMDPALPVFLLDHVPFEPWMGLTNEYIAKGWMRRTWGQYEVQPGGNLWDWWVL